MDMWVGVPEAARELDVDSSRVRALIHDGHLVGEKIGGRWLVDRASLGARLREAPSAGRPLSPKNAWMALFLASGVDLPDDVDAVARWRVRDSLRRHGLSGMSARLRDRADVQYSWALREELVALKEDAVLVRGGAGAAQAHRLGLMSGETVDGYVQASALDQIKREYSLQEAPARGANVILRVVTDKAWHLDGHDVAPLAAVALDLHAYPDARARRVAAVALAKADEIARRL